MIRIIACLLAGILMSFFVFPFEFIFFPNVNTKMMLAVVGIVLALIDFARKDFFKIDKDFVEIIVWAAVVSLIGTISVVYNNTNDYTYATYIVSMSVWISAAYAVLFIIQKIHCYLSVTLVCNYLIGVCVAQCFSALLIDYVPEFNSFVNNFALGVGFAYDFQDIQGSRLYGIGAMLDVAGQRFSCVLFIITFLCLKSKERGVREYIWIYVFSFLFIAIVGNMIGRTTTVGLVLSIMYMFFVLSQKNQFNSPNLWSGLLGVIAICSFVYYMYNNNEAFHYQFRFGFEGFFSLFETGEWHTHSNSVLSNMYRLPDNVKTWIIGDGYFDNPSYDLYYTGYHWKGFYMGTDVGYLRFIYYFGLGGMLSFCIYFMEIGVFCCKRLGDFKPLIVAMVLINYIVWFKVSSDVFMILCLFLLVPMMNDKKLLQSQPG